MVIDDQRLNAISEWIIGFAFAVSNVLGVGFLEKVYENALAHEIRKAGLAVAQQHGMTVRYDGVMRAANLPLCLLINFGKPGVEVRRIALRSAA